MSLYLYLREESWQDTWTKGGEVPISRASSYVKAERNGIYTVDENIQRNYNSDVFDDDRNPILQVDKYSTGINMNMKVVGDPKAETNYCAVKIVGSRDININGSVALPGDKDKFQNMLYSLEYEDVFVMCFSTELSLELQPKFCKAACVQIVDIYALQKCLDEQIGVQSKLGPCEYVTTNQRSHFKKSVQDRWQKEWRLVWQIAGTSLENERNLKVTLPAGIAKPVSVRRKFKDTVFSKETVKLDGNSFEGCVFENCELQFAGIEMCNFSNSEAKNSSYSMTGAAQSTIEFLTNMYNRGGEGGKIVVEQVFDAIRSSTTTKNQGK